MPGTCPGGGPRDPYRIWVSEIMLQQTRVAAVLGYYARFLAGLPHGGGFGSRPGGAADEAVGGPGLLQPGPEPAEGRPDWWRSGAASSRTPTQDLLALPGVGDYTASAIASAAFGQREAAVDGNVLRVVIRLTDCHDDIADPKVKKAVRAQVQAVMPETEADIRIFNQATMELGATVCVPNGPPRC